MKKRIISIVFAITFVSIFIGTLIGCQKEKADTNTMVLYTAHKDIIIDLIVDMFTEETGINVEVITAGTGELMARLKTEAGNPNADVFWGGAMNNFLPELKLFADYVSPNDSNSAEGFRTEQGKIARTSIIPSVIIVNTTELEKITGVAGIQVMGYQSIIDLAKQYPELKGKISNANPSKSSSAFEQLVNQVWAFAYIEAKKTLGREPTVDDITQAHIDASWGHVAELVAVYDGKHAVGSSAAITDVVQGETVIGLTHEGGGIEAAANSDDVIMVYPEEGAVVKAVGAGIIKDAKNMENAKAFIDFLLSPTTQNNLKTVFRRPVMINADLSGSVIQPLESFKVIFDNPALNNKAEFIKKYNALF